MKKLKRLAVFVMCIACLMSLFGCVKGHLVDGPGMERSIWCEFTLSRCSERFESVYSYTVTYNDSTAEAFLWEGEMREKSISLPQETVNALFNLDLLSLPEAGCLSGSVVGLAVTDMNGRVYSKQISSKLEEDILAILKPSLDALKENSKEDPFMLDGPDMEHTLMWTEFSLSRSDSYAQYNFSFTVTKAEPDSYVKGVCRDNDGNEYDSEAGMVLSADTLEALHQMNLQYLPNEEPWPEGLEIPLDMEEITLRITLSDGTVEKKNASSELSMKIYQLLLPYFVNNPS